MPSNSPSPIELNDTLQSGFRERYNETVKAVIISGQDTGDNLVFQQFENGKTLVVPLINHYNKTETAELISSAAGGGIEKNYISGTNSITTTIPSNSHLLLITVQATGTVTINGFDDTLTQNVNANGRCTFLVSLDITTNTPITITATGPISVTFLISKNHIV